MFVLSVETMRQQSLFSICMQQVKIPPHKPSTLKQTPHLVTYMWSHANGLAVTAITSPECLVTKPSSPPQWGDTTETLIMQHGSLVINIFEPQLNRKSHFIGLLLKFLRGKNAYGNIFKIMHLISILYDSKILLIIEESTY